MIETLVLRRFTDGAPAPVDRATAAATLRRLTIDPGPDGLATIYAGDGGEASLDLAALREPEGLSEAQVDVEVFSRGLADLLHDLASATDMTIAAAPGRRIYLTDGGQAAHLPAELAATAHTCVDGPELYWWLDRESRTSGETTQRLPEGTPRNEALSRGDALRSVFGLFRRD